MVVFSFCSIELLGYYSAPQSIVLQVLYILWQIRPSHSGIVSKQGNAEGCSLHRFLLPRMAAGDDPVQVKFECKEVNPPEKTAELYAFRLVTLEVEP